MLTLVEISRGDDVMMKRDLDWLWSKSDEPGAYAIVASVYFESAWLKQALEAVPSSLVDQSQDIFTGVSEVDEQPQLFDLESDVETDMPSTLFSIERTRSQDMNELDTDLTLAEDAETAQSLLFVDPDVDFDQSLMTGALMAIGSYAQNLDEELYGLERYAGQSTDSFTVIASEIALSLATKIDAARAQLEPTATSATTDAPSDFEMA